jgi:hypothetical protein
METKPEKAKGIFPKIKWFCANPIISFSVGIIGVVLAVYFYYAGNKEPKLIFLLHPVRTPIVQAGKLSDVSVSLRGKPINGDLTAAQFVLWNSGKAPVRHEDILKPLFLVTSNACPIYEATIRSVSRDVIGFQLITNDLASGRLGFDWKILEHNDGAEIQILYGGNQNLKFVEQDGIVVGQKYIPFQIMDVKKTSVVGKLGVAAFFLFLTLVCVSALKENIKKLSLAIRERKIKTIFDFAVGVIFFAGLTLLLGYVTIAVFIPENTPPFGF